MQNAQPEPRAPEAGGLARPVGRIAAVIGGAEFSTGERAALKRMDPRGEPPLAFYRFAFRHLPENWPGQKAAWITICAGIALMPQKAHRPDQPLGKVLAEAGYSEARLERLLAAEDEVLQTLVLRGARLLAAKRLAVNWTDIARLLLSSDREKREAIRMSIATNYYRNLNTKD